MKETCAYEASLVLHKLNFILLNISRATLSSFFQSLNGMANTTTSINGEIQSTVAFITLCWFNNKTMSFYLKQYLPLSMQFVLWYISLSTDLLQDPLSVWLFHLSRKWNLTLDPAMSPSY